MPPNIIKRNHQNQLEMEVTKDYKDTFASNKCRGFNHRKKNFIISEIHKHNSKLISKSRINNTKLNSLSQIEYKTLEDTNNILQRIKRESSYTNDIKSNIKKRLSKTNSINLNLYNTILSDHSKKGIANI